MKPTEHQRRVLAIPTGYHVAQLGGRGSGKTVAGQFAIARHITEWGPDQASVLVVRKRLRSLEQYASDLLQLLRKAFGKQAVRYNANLHVFHVNDHLCINLAHLDGNSSLIDQQGTSRSMVVVEEAGDIPVELIDQLGMTLRKRATDREGNELDRQLLLMGNPGGASHAVLYRRYIQHRDPWVPFEFGGQTWVWVPGTLEDNPTLPEQYETQFEVLREADESIYRAHRFGDWTVAAGGYFETAWDPHENVVSHQHIPLDAFDKLEWGADWGTASPAAFILLGRLDREVKLPDGRILARGTWVVWDEHVEVDPQNANKGTHRSPAQIAPVLKQKTRMAGGRTPRGVMDSAAGAVQVGHGEPTVLDYFRLQGINLRPSRKGPRDNRTETLREKLAARELVITDRCDYLLTTLPNQPRDKNAPDRMSTDGPDHAIDALCYALADRTAGRVMQGDF